jgi:hypothetical protein
VVPGGHGRRGGCGDGDRQQRGRGDGRGREAGGVV